MNKSKTDKEKLTGFLDSITCHCFNKDRSLIAVCPNTNEIFIYDCSKSTDPDKWNKIYTLTEHTGLVSDIDWSPETNQIVSCSHDRNAYVWKFEENEWKPTLCVLRIQKAAIAVRWAPNGLKFAVASGSKQIAVCYYEKESNWWVSQMIKKHKSTVLQINWSPNSHLLVTSGCDMKCRIASAFDKKIDTQDTTYDHIFGKERYKFGEILAEFDQAKAWVNTAAWSPDGLSVSFVGQGSTFHYVDLSQSASAVYNLYLKDLPFLNIEYINSKTIVGAGFDSNPGFIVFENGNLNFKGFAEKKADKSAAAPAKSSTVNAFAMFQQADNQGKKFGDTDEKKYSIFTTHKNTINCLRLSNESRNLFSTSGLDGRVTFWDASKFL